MANETWCRLETPAGPSFGLVEGERIELVEGSPFASFTRTGRFTPLSEARLLVPVIPPTFYAIGSNYHDHVIKMAEVMGRKVGARRRRDQSDTLSRWRPPRGGAGH